MTTNNEKLKWIYGMGATCFCAYFWTACSVNQAFQITNADTERLQNRGYGYSASKKELEEGYKLYVVKCGNCHNLVIPTKYTSYEWKFKFLERELQTAKVEDEREKKLISMFILAKAR
ncbi:MAG: hypothetical protein RL329_2312 [Bacteroidota bacterium]|jgi:hypothetical protein